MKVGIFTTFVDQTAYDLITGVIKDTNEQPLLNTNVEFVFCDREQGENAVTDKLMDRFEKGYPGIELVQFSAKNYEPQVRKEARAQGSRLKLDQWRDEFAGRVLGQLDHFSTDYDLLIGDMWIWGDALVEERDGINLHPALPDGPVGEWQKVVRQLVDEGATHTGVTMHRVSEELDRGPVVSFCKFPIEGLTFDQIREQGVLREETMITETVRLLGSGDVGMQYGIVIDRMGRPFHGGVDLTARIDDLVLAQTPEGSYNPGRRK